MSKAKTITLKGISRTPYEFKLLPWGTEFSALNAVYAVLKRGAHGYSVIYVSHTCDLSDCFKEHELKSSLDKAGGTHIGIRIETMASSRMSIHTDLLTRYMPVCNCNAHDDAEKQGTYKINPEVNSEQVAVGRVA